MDSNPASWDSLRLDELANCYAGGTPNRALASNFGGGIPWVKSGEVNADEIRETEETISLAGLSNSSARWVPPDTPLIAMYGATAGQVSWLKIPATTNQAVLAIEPTSALANARWLFWALKRAAPRMLASVQGSGQPNLSKKALDAFQLRRPPLAEQRQIASILDTLDETIRKTEQLIAKLKLMKQGLLHDLLTRGIDDNGELRDPERHPEQFKDSPLGRIPKGWEAKLLGSLLEAIQQGWSPDCASTPARQGEWGVLKTTAVQWSGFSSDANKALPGNLAPRPDIEVHEGDVLLTRAGPASRVGVVSFVVQTQPKLMLSDKLYRLVPNATLHPRFLALALSGQQAQGHLSSMQGGLAETQEKLSHAIVRALRILHPPLEEQRLVSALAVRCDEREVQEVALVAKLRFLKTALMEDLLTGRVRTTHLEAPT